VVNQSTVVFFYLLAAFLIFITERGELPAYVQLLYGKGTPAGGAAPGAGGAASAPTGATAANAAATAAPYVLEALS
jgi:hypothetical protein